MRFKDTVGISHLLKNTENLLRNEIDKRLARLGTSLAQYSALSALEMNERLTNAQLARECGVTPQTMNRIMAGLVDNRLVRKKADDGHGLKQNYELTSKAEKLLCDAHAAVNSVELRGIKGLARTELENLQELLRRLQQNLHDSGN